MMTSFYSLARLTAATVLDGWREKVVYPTPALFVKPNSQIGREAGVFSCCPA